MVRRRPQQQTSPSEATACSEEGTLPAASSWQPASDSKKKRQRGNATLCAHVVEDTLEGDHLQAITADDQEETHAAFAATLPALTVSDTACAQVDAAAAAFADSVSDAINIASEASSAVNAISKAKAFALNAASKAAFAKRV